MAWVIRDRKPHLDNPCKTNTVASRGVATDAHAGSGHLHRHLQVYWNASYCDIKVLRVQGKYKKKSDQSSRTLRWINKVRKMQALLN